MSAQMRLSAPRLRPMRLEDVPTVLAVETAGYEFPWSEGIFEDCLRVGYNCWLFERSERLCGYGIMVVALDEAHILNLCVHPELHNQGIGRAIMEFLIDLAKEHHAEQMFLEVRPSNLAAQHLYHSLGFTQVGRRRAYYPAPEGREDALVLVRKL